MPSLRTHLTNLATMLAACCAYGAEQAAAQAVQGYPNKAIRLIVPYPPSGPTDIHSRTVAQKLSEAWGQPVVVENRPGASGMIGTEVCAHAPPDGYTICTVTPPFTTMATLNPKLSFSPANDFTPIALLGAVPNILVVHPSLPVKSVKEFISLAKARPSEILYPTGGIGGTQWLALMYFEQLSRTKLVEVQYKGAGPVVTALISGEVSVAFSDLMTTLPQVQAGRLRLLAVTSAKRSSLIPATPTVSEAGLPGFDVTAWFGLVTRTGTATSLIDKLSVETLRVLQLAEVRRRLTALGSEPGSFTAVQFGEFLKKESEKWARVIKTADVRQ